MESTRRRAVERYLGEIEATPGWSVAYMNDGMAVTHSPTVWK